ncbi:thermonuclease family protein [Ferrovibrio sp.]|uniref:thermonuclease family protein n=1 Tax=Ferrovibrio sp. TaxID=1917215 RepID=UPI003D0BB81D
MFALLCLCLAGNARLPAALAADITGPAQVKDGDSLYIAGREIRLFGIDAPEWRQDCTRPGPDGKPQTWRPGQQAAAWLKSWLAERSVSCATEAIDKYKRVVATCFVAGDDIGARMVSEGWAYAYTRYSPRYAPLEAEARAARRGLHAGSCDAKPEAFRHGG